MIGSPDDEVPVGSMPEPGEQEGTHDIHQYAWFTAAIASKRYVDIIAKPGGQGNVPAVPEGNRITRKVGMVEISAYINAKCSCRAPCDIRIGREVGIASEQFLSAPSQVSRFMRFKA